MLASTNKHKEEVMKRLRIKNAKTVVLDEHELLQQDDFTWLVQLKEAVSPYWAARIPFLAIQGLQGKGR
jgi:hypothetical protein